MLKKKNLIWKIKLEEKRSFHSVTLLITLKVCCLPVLKWSINHGLQRLLANYLTL